jgi:hypothetical protein
MDRYLLFAGDTYYPSGGWSDFRSSHSLMLDAVQAAARLPCDWHHVVDSITGEVVA